jgi:hypothetical protein
MHLSTVLVSVFAFVAAAAPHMAKVAARNDLGCARVGDMACDGVSFKNTPGVLQAKWLC